jgi:hypothetical protein
MKPNHNHRECHIFPASSSILGHFGQPKYAGDFTQEEANQLDYVLGQHTDNAVQVCYNIRQKGGRVRTTALQNEPPWSDTPMNHMIIIIIQSECDFEKLRFTT